MNVKGHVKNTAKFWDTALLDKEASIIKSPVYIDKSNIVIDWLKEIDGNVLDIGMGYGHIEQKLVNIKNRRRIFGLDITNYSKEKAAKLGIRFDKRDVEKSKFIKYKFQAVLALDVLEHLSKTKMLRVINLIYRVMNAGGLFIVSVPINENRKDFTNNRHNQRLNEFVLNNYLKQVGFSVVRSYNLFAYNNFYYIKSFLSKTFKIGKPNLLIIVAKKI